jgi:hypothetical protein
VIGWCCHGNVDSVILATIKEELHPVAKNVALRDKLFIYKKFKGKNILFHIHISYIFL